MHVSRIKIQHEPTGVGAGIGRIVGTGFGNSVGDGETVGDGVVAPSAPTSMEITRATTSTRNGNLIPDLRTMRSSSMSVRSEDSKGQRPMRVQRVDSIFPLIMRRSYNASKVDPSFKKKVAEWRAESLIKYFSLY